MFRGVRLYLKIHFNRMELLNLETGVTVSAEADLPFSGRRQAVADFNASEILLRDMIEQLGLRSGLFSPSKHMLIHQLVLRDGGLSQTEQRVLRELGYMAGVRNVLIVDQVRALTPDEAIAAFTDPVVAHR